MNIFPHTSLVRSRLINHEVGDKVYLKDIKLPFVVISKGSNEVVLRHTVYGTRFNLSPGWLCYIKAPQS